MHGATELWVFTVVAFCAGWFASGSQLPMMVVVLLLLQLLALLLLVTATSTVRTWPGTIQCPG